MSKCKKCGADIPDNVKFCPECGAESSGTSVNGRIVMKCQQCSGTLTMDKEGDILVCPYCGSKELLLDSDNVAVEKIKQQTEFKKWEREDQKEQQKKKEEQEHKYKFGAFGVISIICAVFFGLMALLRFTSIVDAWGVIAGITALIGFLAFVASIMFRRGIIKTDKSYLATVIMIGGFLLFIPFFIFNAQIGKTHSNSISTEEEIKEFTWPDSELAAMLPKPKSSYGKINIDSSTSLSIDVAKTPQSDFDEYVSQCKEKGFTEDYYRSDSTYSAQNKEKYSLRLYLDSENEMSISLNAPEAETTAAPKTTKSTEKETQKPTEKPTKKPTEKPTQAPTEKPTEAATKKPASGNSSGIKPGQSVSGDALKFTFEKAKLYDEIEANAFMTNTPDDGCKYLVLFFEVENISNKKRVVSRVSFTAKEDGNECEQVILIGDPDGYDDLNGTLKAGEKMKGCLIYQVKNDWQEFSVSYEKLWGDSKTYEFYVTPNDIE